MKRLSGTDALFLSTETPAWHQHVGGLTVVDPAESDRFSFAEVRQTLIDRIDRRVEVPVEAEGGPAPPRPGGDEDKDFSWTSTSAGSSRHRAVGGSWVTCSGC